MNAIQKWDFKGHEVRTVPGSDGEEWWVAKDVCDVLEIANVSDAMRRLDDDEKMTLGTTEGHSGSRGGAQSLNIINESGLYSLILTSRKPEAKAFKKWVTSVVLPAIRKTGRYDTGDAGPGTRRASLGLRLRIR